MGSDIVDDRGDLIAFGRMAGAAPATVDDAIGKAMTSAILVRSSGPLAPGAASKAFRDINARTGGRMRFVEGGLLVSKAGRFVGAIGVSGAATPQQDEAIARSVLTKIE